MTLVVAAATVVGCAPVAASNASCETAFDELPALEASPGLFVLVSDKLAQTLTQCTNAEEWKTQLAQRPEVVGESSIAKDELDEYLNSACDLLTQFGADSFLCAAR